MEYKRELKQKMERNVSDYVTKGVKIIAFVLFIIGLTLLVAYFFMLLWNWLIPGLFNVPTIGYWQAMGLLVLAKIIFGFGGGKGPGKSSKRSKGKHKGKSCSTLRKDFSEWKHYDQFWKEEGEALFKNYVERQKSNGEKEPSA